MRTRTLLTALALMLLLPFGVAAEERFNYSYFEMTYLDNGLDSVDTSVDGLDRTAVTLDRGDGMGIRLSLAMDRNIHVFAGYSGSNMDLKATHTAPFPTMEQMGAAFFTTPASESWDYDCDLDGDGSVNFADLAMLRAADGATRLASEAIVGGDLTDWQVGVGYNTMLRPNIGAYVQLFWDSRDLDFGRTSFMGATKDFSANDHGVGATIGLRGQPFDRLELGGWITYSPVGDIDMLAAGEASMLGDDTLIGVSSEFWFSDYFSVFAEVEGGSDLRAWMLGTRYAFRS